MLLIDDCNDNAPYFRTVNEAITISEDIPVGTRIVRLQYTDVDLGKSILLLHGGSILDNDFQFSINTTGNEGDHFGVDEQGVVYVRRSLDRETQDRHNLSIILSDHQSPFPFHTISTTIIVTVADVNDNSPRFISRPEFRVAENSPRGTPVGTLKAEDPDAGIAAMVVYRIDSYTLPEAQFSVDRLRGEITVTPYCISKYILQLICR